MRIPIAGTFLLITALSGCTVQKTLVPTGGSRADGTVELSYEYTDFEKPIVDYAQGTQVAREHCAAWGYSDATPFGGEKTQCKLTNAKGACIQTLVTVQYQCIGSPQSR